MQKVKVVVVHKVKADVTREVIGGIRVGAGGCKDKCINVFIRAVGKPLDVAKVRLYKSCTR